MGKILIYAEEVMPRLVYVLDVLLKERMGLAYETVSNAESYVSSALPGICYSVKPLRKENGIHIPASGLLIEKKIRKVAPGVSVLDDMPVLFPAEGDMDIPFDLFSAVFYMLSRYEEYLPFEPDEHGRFPATAALACKNDLLDIPIVDRWALYLAKKIRTLVPGMVKEENEWHFLPTFDVDQVFAVRSKSLFRLVGGGMKAGDLKRRWRVWQGREKDPFDTFDGIREIHESKGLKPFFFFHVGQWGKYDKSVAPEKEPVKELIRTCYTFGRVGLHPSYHSFDRPELLMREKVRLEKVLGHEVTSSRQHFIRLRFPGTYRSLLEAGIREDYSMGFPDQPGFRAGTAYPFKWFDLERNEITDLTVFPFVAMDGALKKKFGTDRGRIFPYLEEMRKKIMETGGWFITLWHNHTLSDRDDWEGWRNVYETWLKTATQKR